MPALKVFIRYVVIGLSLALQPFVAHSAASQTWPQPPSQLSLDSPYGTLQVSQSDYVYEAQLQLDSQIIAPELKGLINIPYAFRQSNNQTALISVDNGLGVVLFITTGSQYPPRAIPSHPPLARAAHKSGYAITAKP